MIRIVWVGKSAVRIENVGLGHYWSWRCGRTVLASSLWGRQASATFPSEMRNTSPKQYDRICKNMIIFRVRRVSALNSLVMLFPAQALKKNPWQIQGVL